MCKPHYQKKWRGIDPETYVIPKDHPAHKAPPCLEEGCQRVSISRGLCDYHRLRARQGKATAETLTRLTPECAYESCDRRSRQGGYCQGHYEQLRLTGTLKPLREYGKYVKGELRCPIPNCHKPQISSGMCGSHLKMREKYRVPIDELIIIWSDPRCSNPGCTETKRLHMDHDHATGKFRALLCSGCNSALGMLKEDTARIEGLVAYLARFTV